ncbi:MULTISPECIES: acyl-CoA dehydrogenase family protein [Oceanobacillus]|uniref:Acyl-CoA dehydrogenase n=1 Tax=Oceanobacillus kimchii TaxID=746691 RepID=A0ABQ5TEA4_9BACI|nr:MULTISPECIES: acyl-CoA dehydrogenase family protein [Oceanobacillus]MBT2600634.1 acyl-CoA dehydrogenase family protein [Oceanobacillus sp. ISL-74]MBT2650969.1 acyl-CoA dehydrogenase family protein [Oceanobacillus sp. ISL-73]MCT1578965.1 acyl-CoA dehydrogenase family protein [Oceanobacillus kimchii]MCT2137890.1 acyl-CoA dehydrogenase family protein [Oceanobacillus kimchii]GLO65136.1 acyl-CoA dehydrogenase [Oceanobacillus kimchii]
MNFELDKNIQSLKENVRNFIQTEVEQVADDIEQKNRIPERIIELSKEMGLFGLSIPEHYGGIGIGMIGKCALYEEIGATHNGYTTLIGAHTGIGTVGIVEMGNEEQKQKYLPSMASGEKIGAFALTEPEAGSNASALKTSAVKKGDKYILNGIKHYITNATEAEVFTVMAVTDPTKGAKGISSFIVEKRAPGFHIGAIEEKMGLRGSHSAEIILENCEVPAENLLGEEGQGYVNALKILTNGRAGLAARNLGSSQKLLDMSTTYAIERKQFGKSIIEHQAVAHMLAEMAVEIEALRALTYKVAWMVDNGENVIKEAAMLKLYGSEVYNRVADKAVQVHGGIGYISDFPVERFYRDARITRIYEGTSEIQKNIIAGQLKKHYS